MRLQPLLYTLVCCCTLFSFHYFCCFHYLILRLYHTPTTLSVLCFCCFYTFHAFVPSFPLSHWLFDFLSSQALRLPQHLLALSVTSVYPTVPIIIGYIYQNYNNTPVLLMIVGIHWSRFI